MEQCYRDNRLNPIHEGTHGIQALDLLGRKVWQANSKGLLKLATEIQNTIESAKPFPELEAYCLQLEKALALLDKTTRDMGKQLAEKGPDVALANASQYLSLFGHVVVAWIWLWQACAAAKGLQQTDSAFYKGKLQACRFFYRWELPKIQHWSNLLVSADDTCRTMHNDYF